MYREIVVPIDGASAGFDAVPTAAEFSRRGGVALALLSLVKQESGADGDRVTFEQHLAELDRARIATVVRHRSSAGKAITAYAEAADRLICMAPGGGSRLLHPVSRGVAGRVANHSTHPILTVGRNCRPDRRTGIRRLIVALDGTEAGEHALDVATSWATTFDLELELVQVHQVERHPTPAPVTDRAPAAADVLECATVRRRAAEVARQGVSVTYDVLHSRHRNPAAALMSHARSRGGGVLVTATKGHRGLTPAAPANVTHRLVARAPVPVLVTHSDEDDDLPSPHGAARVGEPARGVGRAA